MLPYRLDSNYDIFLPTEFHVDENGIQLQGVISAKDYVRINFVILAKNVFMIIAVTCLTLALIFTVPDLIAGRVVENYSFVAAFALIVLLYVVVRPALIRRNYKKSTRLQVPVHWQLSDSGLSVSTVDSDNRFKWEECLLQTKNTPREVRTKTWTTSGVVYVFV